MTTPAVSAEQVLRAPATGLGRQLAAQVSVQSFRKLPVTQVR